MAKKKELLPGQGPLFPGKKYEAIRGVFNIGELKRQARILAIELGPDHPQVKTLRKEISDREK